VDLVRRERTVKNATNENMVTTPNMGKAHAGTLLDSPFAKVACWTNAASLASYKRAAGATVPQGLAGAVGAGVVVTVPPGVVVTVVAGVVVTVAPGVVVTVVAGATVAHGTESAGVVVTVVPGVVVAVTAGVVVRVVTRLQHVSLPHAGSFAFPHGIIPGFGR